MQNGIKAQQKKWAKSAQKSGFYQNVHFYTVFICFIAFCNIVLCINTQYYERL